MKVIHVAGTNGKGSVCVYLDAMLRSEGKSAGLFVSPHLIRMNERIRIRGEQISDAEFVRVFEQVMEKVRERMLRRLPTRAARMRAARMRAAMWLQLAARKEK